MLGLSKASLGPYAWQYQASEKRLKSPAILADAKQEFAYQTLPLEEPEVERQTVGKPTGCSLAQKNNWEDRYLEHADLRKLERSKEVFRKIEMDPCLSLSLPRPTATNAGAILEHAAQTFEKLYSKYQPMTFKFGITHDASVRWRNETFGYTHSKGDKFDHMLVVYAAANPYGPAFLEASMIQRFGSDLFAVFIF